MNSDTFKKVDEYIIDLFAQEDEVLKKVQARNDALGVPQINISPSQGKLLQMLAQLASAKNILEVGTCAGYSTIWLASALGSDGKLLSLEIDPVLANIAKENFRLANLETRIELRLGNALDTLKTLCMSSKESGLFVR